MAQTPKPSKKIARKQKKNNKYQKNEKQFDYDLIIHPKDTQKILNKKKYKLIKNMQHQKNSK